MVNAIRKFFHLEERQASFKSEIIGGLVTFAAMIYILPVNSSILSSIGMSQEGVFVSTALVSFLVTLIMGVFANYPIALSAGMGMNAYLAYTVCAQMGYSWQESMLLLLINGIIFFCFTLTPLRRIIIESIPAGLKAAISIGLGGFILFVGAQGCGLISDSSTLVTLGDFSKPGVLLACLGILLTLGLSALRKQGIVSKLAVPIGLLVTAVVGVIWSGIIYSVSGSQQAFDSGLPIAPWLDEGLSWGANGLKDVIFFGALNGETDIGVMFKNIFTNVDGYIAIFTLIFVNLFDTTATLVTAGRDCGLLDKEGRLVNGQKAMVADAFGALICGPLGTSTVTSFAESTVGISLGAKTGLSSCVTALLFLLAGFAFPVFSIFSYSSVNAIALVVVGLTIMSSSFKELASGDKTMLISGIMTFVTMILTYSLSNGMGIGMITYIVMKVFQGKAKEVSIPVYVIGLFFLLEFVITGISNAILISSVNNLFQLRQ